MALSHGHYDHSGGLPAALDAAPQARLFLHAAALQPRFARTQARPAGAHRHAGGVTQRRAARPRTGSSGPTGRPSSCPGVWCTGPVPRDADREPGDPDFFFDPACTMPDPVPDDQSFWIDTPEGLWVILGCAHAGVLATLEHIDRLTGGRPLARLIGGTHLDGTPRRLASRWSPPTWNGEPRSSLAPCHCTGRPAHDAPQADVRPAPCVTLGSGAVVE